ncbi:unnamed protein product [Cuscuta campestris]|uniref:Uncharacterized protein n=1 Tax=Cuscuta campestris TaxID=132261 RepID=A0A484KD25_9ASTE|nr:unnamed protein product [Cuscuta campestris]
MANNSSSASNTDLHGILQAIKSSDVVENRVQLLKEVGELNITEISEVESLIDSLQSLCFADAQKFVLNFTCLDISQCTLNKTILQVGAKYLDLDISGNLGQIMGLGAKAAIWCRKHLKMTVMSTGQDSQDEHDNLFYQLLLDLLGYASSSFSALTRYPIADNKDLITVVESFILEQMNLIRDSISEMKTLSVFGSEMQKMVQEVLDSLMRLCRVYSDNVNWDSYRLRTDSGTNIVGALEVDSTDHVVNVIKISVEKLCEVGITAGNNGGSSVSLLNLSWKGVVTLLQLGKGSLAVKVDIAATILSLISLANNCLRIAADEWSSPQKETVSFVEAKRIFLPVKFYLINAVRIISQYPTQSFSVFKDITLFLVKVATFKILLCNDELLKFASEAMVEILDPTSLHILNSFLNSAQLQPDHKFQLLDWMFGFRCGWDSDYVTSSSDSEMNSMNAIFCSNSDDMHSGRALLPGRVIVFLTLLNSAQDIDDAVRTVIARKLDWLMGTFVDDYIYSLVLGLQIPTVCSSTQKQEVIYEPIFHSALHALKTFMITGSSSSAWCHIEHFLLENIFHPHFLCHEIITELWCFMCRHAEKDIVHDIIDKLCSLLQYSASPESVFSPHSALRKVARFICRLVSSGSESMADKIYTSVVGNSRSHCSSIMYLALLMEGFSLDFLSNKLKSSVKQQIVVEYFEFLDTFQDKLPRECGSDVYGAPVFALSAVLQSRFVSISDTEMKSLKFLVSVIHKYNSSMDTLERDVYRRLLSETLTIVSKVKNLYSSDDMEAVVVELQSLFISSPSDSQLYICKPNLSSFMAGLGYMELSNSEDTTMNVAVRELYHMLLQERHWAFAHLAISAFGFFAARTNCNELWRYVPPDAALSFDSDLGNEAGEERFMSELRVFLEKETSSSSDANSVPNLRKEGQLLKETARSKTRLCGIEATMMEVDDNEKQHHQSSRKRKLPEGISQGMELLQSGLKVMGDSLSTLHNNQFDSIETHEKFVNQISQLKEVITSLAGLARA